jgi:hypothetical protein
MAGPEGAAELAVFFDAADGFGELATFTHAGGVATELVVIWTDAHVERPGAFGTVSGTQPVVTLALDHLAAPPAQGDAITVRGATWRVADVQPGGTGLVRLMLEG